MDEDAGWRHLHAGVGDWGMRGRLARGDLFGVVWPLACSSNCQGSLRGQSGGAVTGIAIRAGHTLMVDVLFNGFNQWAVASRVSGSFVVAELFGHFPSIPLCRLVVGDLF